MEEIIVRKAECADAARIAEIWRNDLGYDCSEELVRRKLPKLEAHREAVFTAEQRGQVVGVIHVEKYETLYMETLGNILGLAVSGEFRRRGVGRRLMQAAEEWAGKIGAVGVRLSSGGYRKEAHAFYRALGYGSEKTQIRFLKELPQDAKQD